ncbi:beta-ketoacyl synthase chain length factor [Microbulbifer spongiae]|uniref:Beta-ketoacyl synthase chain length factor n=1 Tax=Microbulbifer spongiae TaxID=2944933 RepID=A0ABY9EAA0_9GAMM|nr:beta-ketoacyl synthase chain length factor [Microbulbifer sp. MI-G]WKD49928.1 beta-ketoacyl synthase chain length factor [Microbulbifer sp. MI-G]
MSIEFLITAWRAWYSGISELSEWQRWRCEKALPEGENQADVSFLTAMQRRRLSPLSKAALNAAYPLLKQRDIPLLCCSVHGESVRTHSLLKSAAAAEDLSPTAFGLSVHNGIAGQLSILCSVQSPAFALAGGDFPLLAGLLEAVGILQDGAEELLIIFYEEPLPEMYQSSAQSPANICVTAMHLAKGTNVQDKKSSLVLSKSTKIESAFEAPDYQLPLISALVEGYGVVPLGKGWELHLNAA